LSALADAVGKPNQFLLAVGSDADDHEQALRIARDLSAKRYVYVWADGIYVQARLEDEGVKAITGRGLAPAERASFLLGPSLIQSSHRRVPSTSLAPGGRVPWQS
jgi:hypothetical protein